ncbi:MAG: glycosyltransferase family protein [Bacteroidetes bacterium]|nr:glycosyltransferase family protein [Bacteroidota bacterium]
MTSTRLPGKVFKEILGKPLLGYHLDRLRKTGFRVIVATTTNTTDDCICEYAEKNSIPYFRGSESNVLSRYYDAASKFHVNPVVRVTSDCPLIDPQLIMSSLKQYMQMNDPDLYISNGIERTFARGFDFEIFSFKALEEAYNNAREESDLEHVTPFIWKNKSGKTKFFHIRQIEDHSQLRITVDTPEDFTLIRHLIENYHATNLSFAEIESILLAHPELVKINASIEQKKVN